MAIFRELVKQADYFAGHVVGEQILQGFHGQVYQLVESKQHIALIIQHRAAPFLKFSRVGVAFEQVTNNGEKIFVLFFYATGSWSVLQNRLDLQQALVDGVEEPEVDIEWGCDVNQWPSSVYG